MSCFFFLFLLSLAEVFQFLRQNSLIMAITKAGKQLYKFDTQVLVRISAEAGFFFKKNCVWSATVSRQATLSLLLLTSHFQSQIFKNSRNFYRKYAR